MAKVILPWTDGIGAAIDLSTKNLVRDFTGHMNEHVTKDSEQIGSVKETLAAKQLEHETSNALAFSKLLSDLDIHDDQCIEWYLTIQEDIDKYQPLEDAVTTNLATYRADEKARHELLSGNHHPGYLLSSRVALDVPPLDPTGKVPPSYLPSDVLYADTPAIESWLIGNLGAGAASEKLLLNPMGSSLLAKIFDPTNPGEFIPLSVVTDSIISSTSSNPLMTSTFSKEIVNYQPRDPSLVGFSNLSFNVNGFLAVSGGTVFQTKNLESSGGSFVISGSIQKSVLFYANLSDTQPSLINDSESSMGSSPYLSREDHAHAVGPHGVEWNSSWEANIRNTPLTGFSALVADPSHLGMTEECEILRAYASIQYLSSISGTNVEGSNKISAHLRASQKIATSQNDVISKKITGLEYPNRVIGTRRDGFMRETLVTVGDIGYMQGCPSNLSDIIKAKESRIIYPVPNDSLEINIYPEHELYHSTLKVGDTVSFSDLFDIPIGRTFFFTGGANPFDNDSTYATYTFKSTTRFYWYGSVSYRYSSSWSVVLRGVSCIAIHRLSENSLWVSFV